MKKSLFALMMAFALCMSACAMAETVETFTFTTEQYVESFQTAYADATVTQEQENIILQLEEAAPVVVTYDMNGLCTSLSAEVKVPLADSEAAGSEGEKFGYAATALMTSARNIELEGDDQAILDDMNSMIQGFAELLNSFTDEDYETCITQPVTHEMEISTHPAKVTLSFDLLSMSLVMNFTYLP